MTFHLSLFFASTVHSCIVRLVQILMSSVHVSCCLPLCLLPSTFPSSACLQMVSCLSIWPKYFNFLLCMCDNSVGDTDRRLHTSMLVSFSVQLILPSLLYIHISNASIFLSVFLLSVQVSQLYVSTGSI